MADRDRRRIKPDAPILHEFNKFEGKPSNIAGRIEHKKGDSRKVQKADVVIERTFTPRPVHRGYIEPHACLISVAPDGKPRSGAPARASSWCVR